MDDENAEKVMLRLQQAFRLSGSIRMVNIREDDEGSAVDVGLTCFGATPGEGDPRDMMAGVLIRALHTCLQGHEVKVFVDGREVKFHAHRPMEQWLAKIIYGDKKI
jgi:hypothetical protein